MTEFIMAAVTGIIVLLSVGLVTNDWHLAYASALVVFLLYRPRRDTA